MPCGCFGKKDKKCGVVGEEYRLREGELPVGPPQSKPLLAEDPTAVPSTPPVSQPQAPPSTPGGGSARLRPEDDPDKATRRRDVVASFYSDQCELIGFKTTSSRPPSTHVGSSHSDGPAATSSPAASSPASTRSVGASCRADLAEKRREFFKDLAAEDETRSRPTSRLTDPGSQVTPRNSHYQDQLHHTLPHLNKTPRSNKFQPPSSPPLFLQVSLRKTPKTSSSPRSSSREDTEPLLHSSPELSPKTSPKHSEHSLASEIPNKASSVSIENTQQQDFREDFSENVPLLSDTHTEVSHSDKFIEVAHTEKSAEVSLPEISAEVLLPEKSTEVSLPENLAEISLKSVEQPLNESSQIINYNQSNGPEFHADLSHKESKFDDNIMSGNENIKLTQPNLLEKSFVIENSVSKDDLPANVNTNIIDNFAIDPQYISDNTLIISSSPKAEVFTPHEAEIPLSGATESQKEFALELDFSTEPISQTLPVIVNETFKDTFTEKTEPTLTTPLDTNTVTLESPEEETIVKTTSQFISVSPDETKTSKTIIETTRQFITSDDDEEDAAKTIVETTQQYIMGSPDDTRTTQTIVETTRHFISGIQEEEEEDMMPDQQFLSSSPKEQKLVKAMEQFVYGTPEEQITQTIVQTTKQVISGGPDGQVTQTVVESTQQSLPPSVDAFFLTAVEEPEDLTEKLLLEPSPLTKSFEEALSLVSQPPLEIETIEETSEELEKPMLPDVPCFGAPPPPSSPPPPLPEGEISADFTLPSLEGVVLPPEEVLPPAPPTPPAERVLDMQLSPAEEFDLKQDQQQHIETESIPSPPTTTEESNEDLPPPPPTPPTPRQKEVHQQPSSLPAENEILPPTPPTPPREDDMPPAQLTPSKDDDNEILPPAPPTPPISSSPPLPPVTCGVEIVSSSPLEDDGLGSEIDDALETLEGLSDEGNIERAAASS